MGVQVHSTSPRTVAGQPWKRAVEIRDRLALPMHSPGFNLVNQDIAAPAMLNRCLRVPEAFLGRCQLFENRDVVIPGDLCKHRLHNWLVPPGFRERTHVLQVARREAFHLGKRSLVAKQYVVFSRRLRRSVFQGLETNDSTDRESSQKGSTNTAYLDH